MRRFPVVCLTLVSALGLGSLSAGSLSAQPVLPTTGTSTTSKEMKEPPYYRGKLEGTAASVAILPVAVAPVAPGLPDNWLPAEALDALASDMTAWVVAEVGADADPATATVFEGWSPQDRSVAPQVYFGCSFDAGLGDCITEERANVLAGTTGNKAWRGDLAQALTDPAVTRVIVLEVGLAPQWIRQRNLAGKKEIRLGTGHTQPLPWLTSLDTPVWVVQVRGAAIDRDGRIERLGAEGVWALRTPFSDSALGGQKILSPADVEHVRTDLRRDDLPDQPLTWQVAAHQLLYQLGALAAQPPAVTR